MSINFHNVSLRSLCSGLFLLLPPLAIVAVMSLTLHPAAPRVALSESAADPRQRSAHFTPWWRCQLRQSYKAAVRAQNYATDAKTRLQAQAAQGLVTSSLATYNQLAGEAPPTTFANTRLPHILTVTSLTNVNRERGHDPASTRQ